MLYENVEEVNHRLANTIVMYDGEPMLVTQGSQRVGGPVSVVLRRLKNRPEGKNEFVVPLDDPALNYRTFALGYINFTATGEALYVTRNAARRTKQGLDDNNVVVQHSSEVGRVNLSTLRSYSDSFFDFMAGRYPTFGEARERFKKTSGNLQSVAFHRNFALHYDRRLGLDTLFFKGRKVGYCGNDNKLVLGPDYQYLRELVHEQKLEGINL